MAVDFGSNTNNWYLYAEDSITILESGDDNYAWAVHVKSNTTAASGNHQSIINFPSSTQHERAGLVLAKTQNNGKEDIKFVGYASDTPYSNTGDGYDFEWSLNTDHNIVMSVDNSNATNVSFYRDGTHSVNLPTYIYGSITNSNNLLALDNSELYYGTRDNDVNNLTELVSGISKYLIIVDKSLTSDEGSSFNTSPTTWIGDNSLQSNATGVFSVTNMMNGAINSIALGSNSTTLVKDTSYTMDAFVTKLNTDLGSIFTYKETSNPYFRPYLDCSDKSNNLTHDVLNMFEPMDSDNKLYFRMLNVDESLTIKSMSTIATPTHYWEFRNGTNGSTTISDVISGQVATITSPNVTFDATNGVHVDNYAGYSNSIPSDGTDSGIKLGDITFGGQDYTIEMYMKVDHWETYSVYFKGFNSDHTDKLMVVRNNNDTTKIRAHVGDSDYQVVNVANYQSSSSYHHILMTYDHANATSKFYEDGVELSTLYTLKTITEETYTMNLFVSKTATSWASHTDGYIKYFRVWNNKALTSDEVSDVYTNRETINYLTPSYLSTKIFSANGVNNEVHYYDIADGGASDLVGTANAIITWNNDAALINSGALGVSSNDHNLTNNIGNLGDGTLTLSMRYKNRTDGDAWAMMFNIDDLFIGNTASKILFARDNMDNNDMYISLVERENGNSGNYIRHTIGIPGSWGNGDYVHLIMCFRNDTWPLIYLNGQLYDYFVSGGAQGINYNYTYAEDSDATMPHYSQTDKHDVYRFPVNSSGDDVSLAKTNSNIKWSPFNTSNKTIGNPVFDASGMNNLTYFGVYNRAFSDEEALALYNAETNDTARPSITTPFLSSTFTTGDYYIQDVVSKLKTDLGDNVEYDGTNNELIMKPSSTKVYKIETSQTALSGVVSSRDPYIFNASSNFVALASGTAFSTTIPFVTYGQPQIQYPIDAINIYEDFTISGNNSSSSFTAGESYTPETLRTKLIQDLGINMSYGTNNEGKMTLFSSSNETLSGLPSNIFDDNLRALNSNVLFNSTQGLTYKYITIPEALSIDVSYNGANSTYTKASGTYIAQEIATDLNTLLDLSGNTKFILDSTTIPNSIKLQNHASDITLSNMNTSVFSKSDYTFDATNTNLELNELIPNNIQIYESFDIGKTLPGSEESEGGWTLLYRQTLDGDQTNMANLLTTKINENDTSSNAYNIFPDIDNFKNNGKYHLKYLYKDASNVEKFNTWYQSSNPTTTEISEDIQGYEADTINFNRQHGGWEGIRKHSSRAVMFCGVKNDTSHWWEPIGVYGIQQTDSVNNGGYPVDGGWNAKVIEVWVYDYTPTPTSSFTQGEYYSFEDFKNKLQSDLNIDIELNNGERTDASNSANKKIQKSLSFSNNVSLTNLPSYIFDGISNTTTTISQNETLKFVPHIDLQSNNTFALSDKHYNWDFRVDSSTSVTDSISGLTATYMNGLTSTIANGAYFASGGVSSGEYNYINLQDFEIGPILSIELYANFEDTQTWSKLFEFGDSSPSDTNLVNSIRFTRSGTSSALMALTHNSDGGETQRIQGGTIVNGAWTHLVLTISGGSINVYQDGSSIGIGNAAVATQKTRVNHFIGRSLYSSDNYFKGYMKYFRVWQGTALTQSDVTSLYNDRESLSTPPLTPQSTPTITRGDYFPHQFAAKLKSELNLSSTSFDGTNILLGSEVEDTTTAKLISFFDLENATSFADATTDTNGYNNMYALTGRGSSTIESANLNTNPSTNSPPGLLCTYNTSQNIHYAFLCPNNEFSIVMRYVTNDINFDSIEHTRYFGLGIVNDSSFSLNSFPNWNNDGKIARTSGYIARSGIKQYYPLHSTEDWGLSIDDQRNNFKVDPGPKTIEIAVVYYPNNTHKFFRRIVSDGETSFTALSWFTSGSEVSTGTLDFTNKYIVYAHN